MAFPLQHLDAEELGFYDAFSTEISEITDACYKLHWNVSRAATFRSLDDPASADGCVAAAMQEVGRLKNNCGTFASKMEDVLPPPRFFPMVQAFLVLNEYLQGDTEPKRLDEYCVGAYKEANRIKNDPLKGPVQPASTKDLVINLYFRPLYSPITFNLTTGVPSIELSASTPIGTFTATPSYSSKEGIKKVVVIFANKKRYYSLDRPFSLYIPPEFHSQISAEPTSSVLTIVIARAGPSTSNASKESLPRKNLVNRPNSDTPPDNYESTCPVCKYRWLHPAFGVGASVRCPNCNANLTITGRTEQ